VALVLFSYCISLFVTAPLLLRFNDSSGVFRVGAAYHGPLAADEKLFTKVHGNWGDVDSLSRVHNIAYISEKFSGGNTRQTPIHCGSLCPGPTEKGKESGRMGRGKGGMGREMRGWVEGDG